MRPSLILLSIACILCLAACDLGRDPLDDIIINPPAVTAYEGDFHPFIAGKTYTVKTTQFHADGNQYGAQVSTYTVEKAKTVPVTIGKNSVNETWYYHSGWDAWFCDSPGEGVYICTATEADIDSTVADTTENARDLLKLLWKTPGKVNDSYETTLYGLDVTAKVIRFPEFNGMKTILFEYYLSGMPEPEDNFYEKNSGLVSRMYVRDGYGLVYEESYVIQYGKTTDTSFETETAHAMEFGVLASKPVVIREVTSIE